jgi:CheY-like chemotaxis protein
MTELTPRDDERKRVSEILKRVDQLIKSGDFDLAQKETDRAKDIDPRNVYVHAYMERLSFLFEERERKRRADEEALRKFHEEKRRLDEERKREEEERRRREEEARKQEEQRRAEEALRRQADEQRSRFQPSPQPQPAPKRPKPAKQRATIVVVDDDDRLLEVIASMLEDSDFDVRAFSTTDEAYTLLREFTPDLILSDINLETSTMGGFTFYQKVREIDHLYDVPFVFLSGLSDELLIRMGKELGVDDYITKPFSDETLIATIKGKIKRSRQLKERMNRS